MKFTYKGADVAANNFNDLSASAALNWLKNRYQTPLADNSIRVLTYLYFESNVTASTGTLTTDAFLYTTANDWQKIYRVKDAQYASVNRSVNSAFVAADAPNLPNYINTFLKADASVMATAKAGDVIYVNYKYQTSATAIFQRVMALAYDGINWGVSNTSATNLFTLSGGVWTGQLDNTGIYTLASPADYNTISKIPNIGSTAAVANLVAHPNFALAAAVATVTDDGNRWKDDQIATGIISILKTVFTSPSVNQKFVVTFATYGGYTTESQTFNFDGTNFVYLRTPSATKYTLTGDDLTGIARANIGSSAASVNLNQYGNFSSAWTQDQINAGIAATLKSRYSTAATANQVVTVTYPIYSGGNVTTTRNFKYDGTNWTAQ